MNNKLASIKIVSWEFIWLLFCCFMTIVWVSEVWDVKTAPEKYACLWGGEGPVARLWYYASERLYLLHLVCLSFGSYLEYGFVCADALSNVHCCLRMFV